MKITISAIFLIAFFLIPNLYGQTKQLKTFTNIDAVELKKIADSDPMAVILDVRTKIEYKRGHIPNSINAKNKKKLDHITDTLDFDQPLLVYCYSGTRSFTACILLKEKGFSTVYNLENGIVEWKESGFETTKK